MNAPANITSSRITAMSGSLLLARLDMSDVENVKDAQHDLRRAGNDPAALAVWAGKWGEALLARCGDAEGGIYNVEYVTEISDELQTAESRSSNLVAAIRDGSSAIDRLLAAEGDALAAKHFDAISKIGDDLEAAL